MFGMTKTAIFGALIAGLALAAGLRETDQDDWEEYPSGETYCKFWHSRLERTVGKMTDSKRCCAEHPVFWDAPDIAREPAFCEYYHHDLFR
jgi:hypothetical protein